MRHQRGRTESWNVKSADAAFVAQLVEDDATQKRILLAAKTESAKKLGGRNQFRSDFKARWHIRSQCKSVPDAEARKQQELHADEQAGCGGQ